MNILECTNTKLGNRIELIGEAKDNNILIVGVFHGDEPQGKHIIEEYIKNPSSELEIQRKVGNNLLFIPCLKEKNLPLVIVGGTVEYHGPHCSYGCDTLVAALVFIVSCLD